jgi:hypothetical protein
MKTFSWTCPFCNQPVTITEESISEGRHILKINNAEGDQFLAYRFIVCPNPKCKRFSLEVNLAKAGHGSAIGYYQKEPVKTWQLIPQSKAQSFPDYIPKVILDDYNEACLIKDLSPKASATLARRCLQGIIRDFWGVKGANLKNEIEQIEDMVDLMTWQAIDAVRSVGNIGAHMEKDINLIVDVEPNEAELLIGLIEILLKDWYIAREQKKSHLAAVVKLAEEKKTARKPKRNNTQKT